MQRLYPDEAYQTTIEGLERAGMAPAFVEEAIPARELRPRFVSDEKLSEADRKRARKQRARTLLARKVG